MIAALVSVCHVPTSHLCSSSQFPAVYSAIKKSFASEIESKVEAQARAKAAKRNAMGLLVVVVVLILLLGASPFS